MVSDFDRAVVVTISVPCPSRASSIELDRISKTACSQPSSPSEPKITPGRLRTRSAPFSEEMLSLPYDGFALLIYTLTPNFRSFTYFIISVQI